MECTINPAEKKKNDPSSKGMLFFFNFNHYINCSLCIQVVDDEGGDAEGDTIGTQGSHNQHPLQLVAGVLPLPWEGCVLGLARLVPLVPVSRILIKRVCYTNKTGQSGKER